MRLFISKLLALIVVFCFLQIPFFMMQYMQHLEGHVEELRLYRQELIFMAEKNKLTLDKYVLHFEDNIDKIVSSQGEVMKTRLARYEEFTKALSTYKSATPWARPFGFLRFLDGAVAKETLSSFQVGFNITLESLCYLAVGLLFGLIFYNPLRSKNGKV